MISNPGVAPLGNSAGVCVSSFGEVVVLEVQSFTRNHFSVPTYYPSQTPVLIVNGSGGAQERIDFHG